MQSSWRPVHHLAWLCQAPQLLDNAQTFPLADHLPEGWSSTLADWSSNPRRRPAALTEPAHPRLGYYFERLYECVLTDLLGWTLLAKNLQVRDGAGRTLGELDFVVQNPRTGAVEHHEIAVKFYLGYSGSGQQTRWFGPNSHDRLDLKVTRLLEHQSRLAERPETRALLAGLGIDGPVMPRIFIPGYLFYPGGQTAEVPGFVPGDHLRGHWLYHHEAREQSTVSWVPLHKPHWLGPWSQQERPDPELASKAVASVEEHHRPRLFAALEQAPETGLWQESARTFVVPAEWPGQARG